MIHLQSKTTCVPTTSESDCSSNYEIRSKTIFRILGWAPIESILRKMEILMTFKAIRCIAPEYVSNMFSHRQNNNYEMRSNMRILQHDLSILFYLT